MGSKQKRQPSDVRTFKGSTVFEWDVEPSDERPSEFIEPSPHLGLSRSGRPSSFTHLPPEVRRARPRRKRQGGATWLYALLVVAAVAGAGLYTLVQALRH